MRIMWPRIIPRQAAACPVVLINNTISDGVDETWQRAQHLVTIDHGGEHLASCPRCCSWVVDNPTEIGIGWKKIQ